MLVLIGIFLVLVPSIVILYPFFKISPEKMESSLQPSNSTDLFQKWARAIDGLKNTDLDWSIGNISQADYLSLRKQYISEATILFETIRLSDGLGELFLDGLNTSDISMIRRGPEGAGSLSKGSDRGG